MTWLVEVCLEALIWLCHFAVIVVCWLLAPFFAAYYWWTDRRGPR